MGTVNCKIKIKMKQVAGSIRALLCGVRSLNTNRRRVTVTKVNCGDHVVSLIGSFVFSIQPAHSMDHQAYSVRIAVLIILLYFILQDRHFFFHDSMYYDDTI